MCQIQQQFMDIMYTEITACLTGVGENKIVEHFIHLKNILGTVLRLVKYLSQNGLKKYAFIFLRNLDWYHCPF